MRVSRQVECCVVTRTAPEYKRDRVNGGYLLTKATLLNFKNDFLLAILPDFLVELCCVYRSYTSTLTICGSSSTPAFGLFFLPQDLHTHGVHNINTGNYYFP